MIDESKAVKLPGGCYLVDRKEEIRKINLRELNVIPFRKYRFEPDPEELEEEWEYESSWIDALLPVIGGIALVMLGLFL